MASVDDEDILEVLRESADPELTTTQVAEELPVTRGTTRTRLQQLVDDGLVDRRRDGVNVVWWLPEREGEGVETDEASDTDADEEASAPEPDDDSQSGDTSDIPEEDAVAAGTDATASTGSMTSEPPDTPAEAAEPAEAAGPSTSEAGPDDTVGGPEPVEVEPRDTIEAVVDSTEFPEGKSGVLRALGIAAAVVVVLAFLRRLLRR